MTDPAASTRQLEMEVKNILMQTLAELRMISAGMQLDQTAIARLKAESRIITAHTNKVLARLRIQLATLADVR